MLVPSHIAMVSPLRTSWTVVLVLVDLVIVFGFPHLFLPLLPLLQLQNSYVSNERLCIALRLSPPLPLQPAPIASTIPLMESSHLEDYPPPRSEASKRPHSTPLFQRHTKRSGGCRSLAFALVFCFP